jgi:hypothetical protein
VLTPGSDRTVFIKALYLEFRGIIKNHTLRVGQFGTPTWTTFTEPKWSYRSVEKTISDMRKISRSNDVGIGMSGTLVDVKSTPVDTSEKPKPLFNFSYNIMYGNGRGAKPEDNNQMKVYYGEIIFKILNNFYLEGFAEYEPINKGIYLSGANAGSTYKGDRMIYKGFIGYEHEKFIVGVETVMLTQQNGKERIPVDSATSAKKDTTNLNQMGVSFWTRSTIIKDKIYAFVRYDIFKNDSQPRGWEYYNKDSDVKKYNESFILVGLDWRPSKNIQVMPNVWINSYKDITSNVTNYKEIKRKSDVVTRVTLFYKF